MQHNNLIYIIIVIFFLIILTKKTYAQEGIGNCAFGNYPFGNCLELRQITGGISLGAGGGLIGKTRMCNSYSSQLDECLHYSIKLNQCIRGCDEGFLCSGKKCIKGTLQKIIPSIIYQKELTPAQKLYFLIIELSNKIWQYILIIINQIKIMIENARTEVIYN